MGVRGVKVRVVEIPRLARMPGAAPSSTQQVELPAEVVRQFACPDCASVVRIRRVEVFHDPGCVSLRGIT